MSERPIPPPIPPPVQRPAQMRGKPIEAVFRPGPSSEAERWRHFCRRQVRWGVRLGWGISALLHVTVFLALAVSLMPANLGNSSPLLLEVSFETEETQLDTFMLAAPEDAQDAQIADAMTWEAPETTEDPEHAAPEMAADLAEKADEQDATDDNVVPQKHDVPWWTAAQQVAERVRDANRPEARSSGRRGDAGGGEGPRAEYFGTVAYGDRFVYIIDMSGSMVNDENSEVETRFQRATAEVIRSIGQLREEQWFYVILFSDRTMRQFDDASLIPVMCPANDENKKRIAQWLRGISPGGGTDPRKAVRLALSMRPGAIFILSDGEFNNSVSTSQTIFQDDSTVYGTVALHNAAHTPIHSFAYEDPCACRNMEAIAKQSGGEYRFIPSDYLAANALASSTTPSRTIPTMKSDEEKRAAMLLRLAQTMESAGKSPKALVRYRKLAQQYPDTPAAQEAIDAVARLTRYKRQ